MKRDFRPSPLGYDARKGRGIPKEGWKATRRIDDYHEGSRGGRHGIYPKFGAVRNPTPHSTNSTSPISATTTASCNTSEGISQTSPQSSSNKAHYKPANRQYEEKANGTRLLSNSTNVSNDEITALSTNLSSASSPQKFDCLGSVCEDDVRSSSSQRGGNLESSLPNSEAGGGNSGVNTENQPIVSGVERPNHFPLASVAKAQPSPLPRDRHQKLDKSHPPNGGGGGGGVCVTPVFEKALTEHPPNSGRPYGNLEKNRESNVSGGLGPSVASRWNRSGGGGGGFNTSGWSGGASNSGKRGGHPPLYNADDSFESFKGGRMMHPNKATDANSLVAVRDAIPPLGESVSMQPGSSSFGVLPGGREPPHQGGWYPLHPGIPVDGSGVGFLPFQGGHSSLPGGGGMNAVTPPAGVGGGGGIIPSAFPDARWYHQNRPALGLPVDSREGKRIGVKMPLPNSQPFLLNEGLEGNKGHRFNESGGGGGGGENAGMKSDGDFALLSSVNSADGRLAYYPVSEDRVPSSSAGFSNFHLYGPAMDIQNDGKALQHPLMMGSPADNYPPGMHQTHYLPTDYSQHPINGHEPSTCLHTSPLVTVNAADIPSGIPPAVGTAHTRLHKIAPLSYLSSDSNKSNPIPALPSHGSMPFYGNTLPPTIMSNHLQQVPYAPSLMVATPSLTVADTGGQLILNSANPGGGGAIMGGGGPSLLTSNIGGNTTQSSEYFDTSGSLQATMLQSTMPSSRAAVGGDYSSYHIPPQLPSSNAIGRDYSSYHTPPSLPASSGAVETAQRFASSAKASKAGLPAIDHSQIFAPPSQSQTRVAATSYIRGAKFSSSSSSFSSPSPSFSSPSPSFSSPSSSSATSSGATISTGLAAPLSAGSGTVAGGLVNVDSSHSAAEGGVASAWLDQYADAWHSAAAMIPSFGLNSLENSTTISVPAEGAIAYNSPNVMGVPPDLQSWTQAYNPLGTQQQLFYPQLLQQWYFGALREQQQAAQLQPQAQMAQAYQKQLQAWKLALQAQGNSLNTQLSHTWNPQIPGSYVEIQGSSDAAATPITREAMLPSGLVNLPMQHAQQQGKLIPAAVVPPSDVSSAQIQGRPFR